MFHRRKLLHILFIVLIFAVYYNFGWQMPEFSQEEEGAAKNLLPYTIRGASMEPTLKDGEQVSVDTNYYKTHNLSRGDIIAFKFKTQEKPFVKRIIALPGDKLEFGQDGNIYINGKILAEPYLLDKNLHFDSSKLKVLSIPLSQTNSTVPEDSVLVLGDNGTNSFDSEDYGFVPVEYIFGKVESNKF